MPEFSFGRLLAVIACMFMGCTLLYLGVTGLLAYGPTQLVPLFGWSGWGYSITPLSMLTLGAWLLLLFVWRGPVQAPFLILFACGIYELSGSSGLLLLGVLQIPLTNFLVYGLMAAVPLLVLRRLPQPSYLYLVCCTFMFVIEPARVLEPFEPVFESAFVLLVADTLRTGDEKELWLTRVPWGMVPDYLKRRIWSVVYALPPAFANYSWLLAAGKYEIRSAAGLSVIVVGDCISVVGNLLVIDRSRRKQNQYEDLSLVST